VGLSIGVLDAEVGGVGAPICTSALGFRRWAFVWTRLNGPSNRGNLDLTPHADPCDRSRGHGWPGRAGSHVLMLAFLVAWDAMHEFSFARPAGFQGKKIPRRWS